MRTFCSALLLLAASASYANMRTAPPAQRTELNKLVALDASDTPRVLAEMAKMVENTGHEATQALK
jgi:hypothetical protein